MYYVLKPLQYITFYMSILYIYCQTFVILYNSSIVYNNQNLTTLRAYFVRFSLLLISCEN